MNSVTTNNNAQETLKNPVSQDTVTFVKTAKETRGQVTETVVTLGPGNGVPLYEHSAFAETFTALEGTLGIQLGRKPLSVSPGESYTVPVGAIHRFYNPTAQRISFKTELRPGHQGHEDMLRIMYGLAQDGQVNKQGIPKDFVTLVLLADMGDVRMAGVFALFNPFFKRIIRRARKKGLERTLLQTYCR